jgi:transposase
VRLKSILREFQFYKEELEKIHQQMEKALQRTRLKDIILSIPGIGVVTAASFLGEVGDVRRFDSWKQIRKLAGYNLVENSSGKRKSRSKISKRGRSSLRSILYQASLILVSKNQEFKVLYKYFKTRPNNPLKSKQALVAIINKLLRVLFALITQGKEYDASKVFGPKREAQLKQAA